MQTAGKAPSVRAQENRIAELEAEIERLRSLADSLGEDNQHTIAKLTEAAAFLDAIAGRVANLLPNPSQEATRGPSELANQCRAMAERLRNKKPGSRPFDKSSG